MGVITLVYSIVVYAAFMASLLYFIIFVGGDMTAFVGAPKSIDHGAAAFGGAGPLLNIGLLLLFGVQHSVMARQGFKRVWTKIVPPRYGTQHLCACHCYRACPALCWLAAHADDHLAC